MTIFFEVEEYLAFVRYQRELRSDLGYDPAEEIRQQIRQLAMRGHDIQLHLHPQWYGARYAAGSWALQPAMQTVDDLMPDEKDAIRYIAERKAVIEEMLADVPNRRPVCVYRAGAFSAQPGQRLIKALVANGFLADSSVVHGLRHHNATLNLDYRRSPRNRRAWRVRDDVATEEPTGPLWEVPIYSIMRRRLHQLTARRLLAKFSRHVPRQRQAEMIDQLGVRGGPWHVLRFPWSPVPIKLDHDNLSPRHLVRWIRSAARPMGDDPDVLVLIGHTKEHMQSRDFETFLHRISSLTDVEVLPFSTVALRLSSRRTEGTATAS